MGSLLGWAIALGALGIALTECADAWGAGRWLSRRMAQFWRDLMR